MKYNDYINDKDTFWRKAKQIEFSRKNKGVEKIQEYLTDKFSELTTRNSMTLRILGLVKKTKFFDSLELTEDGKEFVGGSIDTKLLIINKNLLKFSLNDPDINARIKLNVQPFQIILEVLDKLEFLSFLEYKLFICFIADASEIDRTVDLIKEYRETAEKQTYIASLNDKLKSLGIQDFDDHIKRLFDTFSLSNLLHISEFNDEVYFAKAGYSLSENQNENESGIQEPEEINLEISNDEKDVLVVTKGGETPKIGKSIKIDYVRKALNTIQAGRVGEKVVAEFEKQKLIAQGRSDLVEKVRIVSEYDDALGYDVLSFEGSGKEKHIEVKSVKNISDNQFRFFISKNEMEKHMSDKLHFIYIVFDYQKKTPKIFKLPRNVFAIKKGVEVEPISFEVKVSLNPKS